MDGESNSDGLLEAVLRLEDGAQSEVTARRKDGADDRYWLGKLSAFGEVVELIAERTAGAEG